MKKRKETTLLGLAPPHIAKFYSENPFAAADEFADQVRQGARADAAMGRQIEDARHVARGIDEEDKAQRGGVASGKARSGDGSKKALILAEAASYEGSPAAKVNTIASRIKRKHGVTVTDRYVRKVLDEKKGTVAPQFPS